MAKTDIQKNPTENKTQAGTSKIVAAPEASKKTKVPITLKALVDPIYDEYGQPVVVNENGKLDFNQTAIAHKCAEEYQLQFDESRHALLQYSTEKGLWAELSDTRARGLLAQLVKKITEDCGQPKLAYKVKSTMLSSILNMVKSVKPIAHLAPAKPGLILVDGGVLDLTGKTVTLKEYSADYGFSMGCPFPFTPSAKLTRFQKELLGKALDKDDIALVQRYFGSILLGENPAHRILVLKGLAGSGKSTLVSVLERIIGIDQVAYLRSEHLAGRFEFSGFVGKRLLAGKDVPGDTLSTKGAKLMKSLVGGDSLEGEIKYNPTKVKMVGNFHVVIATNSSLRIALDDDADAWRRRIIVVPFNKERTTNPIPNFADELVREEGPAIFAWLVEGAQAHRKELEKNGNYILTEVQQARIDDMIDGSQSVKHFLKNRVKKNEKGNVSIQELTDGYFLHCQSKNWLPLSDRVFQNQLPGYMSEIHGVIKRHDLTRDEKAVRGYKEVFLAE